MVSRIQHITTPRTSPKTARQRSRLLHTGQDAITCRISIDESPKSNQQISMDLHGRIRPHPQAKSSQTCELDTAFSINIDVHLLTGELDEDISILNIVA